MMSNFPQPILITNTGERLYKKEAMEKLCEYMDAEEAGTLLRLPNKKKRVAEQKGEA